MKFVGVGRHSLIRRLLSKPTTRLPVTNLHLYQYSTMADVEKTRKLSESSLGGSSQPPMKKQKKFKKKKFKQPPIDPISAEGILVTDIKALLKKEGVAEEDTINDMQEFFERPKGVPHPEHREVTLDIIALSSVGEGIALQRMEDGKVQIITVPFTVVGDKVEAKVYKTQKHYFQSDLLKVITPSEKRNDSLINCKYFNSCSGCQYQMLDYEEQLEIKRQVIVNAFKHYAPNLDPSVIPEVLKTVGSPKTYGYRTKLTPHFDVPKAGLQAPPPIGFGEKGKKSVVDIEECAIGTPAVNRGMTEQRNYVHENYTKYKKGATLLLRENMLSPEEKVCTSNTKEIITEYVDKEYQFKYPASSFFQNNNSILPAVTSYVRENIVLPSTGKLPKYLVDTYCGSGLFAVTCSSASESVIGVEISKDSVEYAQKNADLNGVKNASFIVGQAEKIFEKVNTPKEETSIIIDPPRKGCDQAFLNQLLEFKPAKVVYVSCNVHSQARDIDYLLTDDRGKDYQIESIRGFDFFPQTHHVESVAVLSLK